MTSCEFCKISKNTICIEWPACCFWKSSWCLLLRFLFCSCIMYIWFDLYQVRFAQTCILTCLKSAKWSTWELLLAQTQQNDRNYLREVGKKWRDVFYYLLVFEFPKDKTTKNSIEQNREIWNISSTLFGSCLVCHTSTFWFTLSKLILIVYLLFFVKILFCHIGFAIARYNAQ